MTSAGFIWNIPEDPTVLGAYIHTDAPEKILFAPPRDLLRLLGVETDLVKP